MICNIFSANHFLLWFYCATRPLSTRACLWAVHPYYMFMRIFLPLLLYLHLWGFLCELCWIKYHLKLKLKLAIFFRNCTPLKYRGENSTEKKNHTEPKIWVPISRNFLSCPGKVYTWTAHLSTHQKCTHTPTLSKNELGGWATKFIALFIFYRLFWNGFFMRSFTAHFT